MSRLPSHMPIVSVTPPPSADEQALLDALLANLEAEGVRLAILGGNRPMVAVKLVRLLAENDLLIDCGSVVEAATFLSFSENQSAGPQPESEFFACMDIGSIPACTSRIVAWLKRCSGATPVAGAVLIGGRSSRMGRPKHLIEDGTGTAWVEIAVNTLSPFVTDLVISGHGRLPERLKQVRRIDDLPDVEGPLAGVGALFRSRPFSSWLVSACDMPHLSEAAIDWLLAQRRQGCFGVTPKNPRTGRNEPLLSWYDYRCGPLIEDMIASGISRVSALCKDRRILQPPIPDQLIDCWRNINVPEDI